MATLSERIAAIDAILDRGLTRVTDQDGRTHEYDLEALKLQRDRLQAALNSAGCGPTTRRGIYNPAFRHGC